MTAIWTLIGGLRGVIMAIGGAAVVAALFLTWNTLIDNPKILQSGIDKGVTQERTEWLIKQAELREKMEKARVEAQATIQKLEADYLAKREADAANISDLESLIAEMEEHEADPGSNACTCPPAIPRGVSNGLNKVGR